MSTARNIPGDRGLTLRMFTTGLLLVILYGAVVGLLIAFGVPLVAVLVFAGAILDSSKIGVWHELGNLARSDTEFFLATRSNDPDRDAALTMKHAVTPAAAISPPAAAGPRMRDRLNCVELSASPVPI